MKPKNSTFWISQLFQVFILSNRDNLIIHEYPIYLSIFLRKNRYRLYKVATFIIE